MSFPGVMRALALQAPLTLLVLFSATGANAEDVRWGADPAACSGELDTRNETPLIFDGDELRWFNFSCRVVSSYKVKDAFFLQAECMAEGKRSTIPIMLERHGDRLRVGWNREAIRDMRLCN